MVALRVRVTATVHARAHVRIIQHLHMTNTCCNMSRRIARFVLHSQATWHQLMQALQRLDIASVTVMLRVRLHTVTAIASVCQP